MTLPTMRLSPDGRSPDPHRRLAHGVEAVLVRVQLAVETVRGTWIDDLLFGLPIDVWMQRPSTTSAEIEGTIRQVLRAVPGVLEVAAVRITRRPTLTLEADIVVSDEDARVAVSIRATQAASLDPVLLSVRIPSTVLLPSIERLSLLPDPPHIPRIPALPLGAWIIIEPMLSPGTYDGTTYAGPIPDQSGNGRDMVTWSSPASSAEFSVRGGGVVRLPMTSSSDTVYFDSGSNFAVTSFLIIDWCRHDASMTNSRELGATLMNQFGNPLFKSRWLTTIGDQGELDLASSGVGVSPVGGPDVAFPRDGASDAWIVQARSRRVTGNTSVWAWIIVGDAGDGLGARVIHNGSHTESSTMLLTGVGEFQTGLNATRGVELHQGGGTPKEAGGTAVYFGDVPGDDEILLGLVWAAGRFSAAHEATAKALLGVS